MTVVMLCGALVSACNGEDAVQPANERPGGTGAEASIGSSSQAVVSPELAAALTCVETYVNAGTCNWPHWSELWETCLTYEHSELEDGLFLEEVQANHCTVANWPTLRAQLIAPRPQRVRVRETCFGDSPVIQDAASNGCHTLAPTAGASFVEVPFGKSVTLHAGASCTGDSVTVQTDANLCETSFGSGASTNNTVRSFQVQDVVAPPSAYRYTCASEESTCVRNYNSRLGAFHQTHPVRVVRVTLAGKTTPALTTIQAKVREMDAFFAVASRNQMRLELIGSQTVQVTSSDCGTAKTQAAQQVSTSAFLTVYVMPGGVCASSNAGSRRIFLNDNLLRSYIHETGHVLGLGHGNVRDPSTGVVTQYGDASTYMGRFVSENYNLPQIHWLGWTKKEELIQINSAIDSAGFIEVNLRPVGSNAVSTSSLPLGAVWDIPGGKDRLFFTVPKPRLNDANQIGGGAVFVYRAPKCEGCVGMELSTLQLARFGPRATSEYAASGLVVKPVGFTSSFVQVNGVSVEEFTSVKLRIWQ
ncbi:hypothetical protein OV208_12140 [Corallococcus sp. bb12-1]|uniref:hypothetical protein n=1 Tax=Corallococcus sp. bb12-1 TaxID=2996784 RepID=UPI002272152E|nr:hypothetical protein [Corallococcus sp. bb12-1]MCY1042067.1 hypothetical protein [Corallococcus sp. bb12-1]